MTTNKSADVKRYGELMNREERLQNIIDNTNEQYVLSWWNEMTIGIGDMERHIYCMYEFNECFDGLNPLKIAEFVSEATHFSPFDEYWTDGFYGLESFDDLYDIMDDDELIDYMIDNDEDFGDDRIRDVLDDLDDEEVE